MLISERPFYIGVAFSNWDDPPTPLESDQHHISVYKRARILKVRESSCGEINFQGKAWSLTNEPTNLIFYTQIRTEDTTLSRITISVLEQIDSDKNLVLAGGRRWQTTYHQPILLQEGKSVNLRFLI